MRTYYHDENCKKTHTGLNMIAFVIGIYGVWMVTHNGWAVFWAWIASVSFIDSTGEI